MGDKYNSFLIGLLAGLVVPFVGYAILISVYEYLDGAGFLNGEGFSLGFRQRTLVVIAICLNLIPLQIFQRRRANQSIRGLVATTLGLVITWVIYYSSQL